MNTKKINNVKIHKVKVDNDNKNIKGGEMFNDLYFNCMLLSRTNGGKTTTLYNILKKTVDRRTSVYIFCSSVDIDPVWLKTKEMLLRKGCQVYSYPHFIVDGVSVLPTLIESFNGEDGETDNESSESEVDLYGFGKFSSPPIEKPKKRKKYYKDEVPKRVMIFDDLSSGDGVKHPHITKLLTDARHHKIRCFISCHDVTNLAPTALCQLRYMLLFRGISDDRIKELAQKCEIGFDGDDKHNPYLLNLYKYATEEPYSFLYCNKNKDDYRIMFDRQFVL